jgi:hypothetical protein
MDIQNPETKQVSWIRLSGKLLVQGQAEKQEMGAWINTRSQSSQSAYHLPGE